jgi:hypothetical protein
MCYFNQFSLPFCLLNYHLTDPDIYFTISLGYQYQPDNQVCQVDVILFFIFTTFHYSDTSNDLITDLEIAAKTKQGMFRHLY